MKLVKYVEYIQYLATVYTFGHPLSKNPGFSPELY